MGGLQTIISHGSGSSQAGVDDGRPAFQAMVMVAMKNIREANGGHAGGGFDGSESGVVVDDIVGEQRLIAAAAAKVQCGEVVESAGSADGRKEQIVLSIPERMLKRWPLGLVVRVPEAGLFRRHIDGHRDPGPWKRGCVGTGSKTGRRVECQMCRDEKWRRCAR